MIGKIIEGKYRLIAELGEGGMGALYLAEHTVLKKRFAVKRLLPELTQHPEFRERFYKEATHQAQLTHPNIVQAIDFLEEDGQFFFIMEYIEGQDLGKLIKTKGKLSEQEAVAIFKNILGGLKFAHNKAIIHRDIKPSNILIDESGIARITDFGIAILAGERRLTATGQLVGSPWYMSPEQIVHPQTIDRRSDIYSAGIVLYEMLTGEVPFDGETDYSIRNQQVSSPVPNLCQQNPEISQQLGQIVLKAMAKEPDKRFQDCAEFLAAIEAYEKERSVPSKKPSWFLPLLGSLVAIGLAGVGAFMIYHLAQNQKNIEAEWKVEAEHKAAVEQQAPQKVQEWQEKATPQQEERLARQEAEWKAEVEQKAKLEAEYKAKLEAEYKAKLEADRKVAAERQAQQQERQEALDLVSSYYQDMNRRDCGSAYQKWKSIKSPEALCSKIKQTDWTRLNKIEVERIDQDSAIVNVDIIVKSYSSSPERWVGFIPLQRIGGSWKIITMRLTRQ